MFRIDFGVLGFLFFTMASTLYTAFKSKCKIVNLSCLKTTGPNPFKFFFSGCWQQLTISPCQNLDFTTESFWLCIYMGDAPFWGLNHFFPCLIWVFQCFTDTEHSLKIWFIICHFDLNTVHIPQKCLQIIALGGANCGVKLSKSLFICGHATL